ncbi:MAG: hypothetical protein ABSH01_29770, partial [Terriglobia bacterium]
SCLLSLRRIIAPKRVQCQALFSANSALEKLAIIAGPATKFSGDFDLGLVMFIAISAFAIVRNLSS